ncbi:MAG: PorV/PorQ family protein [candidate division Zixibacteria bacterium]|nr:PorV/PorQ family protein [candidate division Zixibacteria bacterium]
MKNIITALAMLLLLVAGSVHADFAKVGSAGAQFLKMGVGPRYQAMGDAAVAVADDIYAAYWNPAGLAEIGNSSVGFTNVNWVLDINLNYFALARYFEDVGTFGVSATVLSMGDQEITTFENQTGTGDFYSATSYAVGISYARQLTNRFYFGGTVKYIGERIYNENSRGFAFDFGTLLHTGFRSLRLGMSISNMGPEMDFDGPDLDVSYDELSGEGANDGTGAQIKTNPYNLPMVFRVGMAYDIEMGPKSIVTVTGEIKHPNDNLQHEVIGAEYSFSRKFFLRSGYKFNYEEEGFTLGGGLKTAISSNTRLFIDYSWQDLGRLQSSQRFSVGFTF